MKLGEETKIRPIDGFTDDAFGWNNAMLRSTDIGANTWFSSLNLIPIDQQLTAAELGGPEDREQFELFASDFFGEELRQFIPGLEIDLETLGEQAVIAETEIGKKLINLLTRLQVSWDYNNLKAVSHDKSIEWKRKDEGVASFPNYFGMPVNQRFRIYVDKAGVETLVWSTELLVANREYLHETQRFVRNNNQLFRYSQSEEYLAKGGMSFGRWSERINLPAMAKNMFFLAETPFPSTTLMSMPRTMAFQGVAVENLPKPFIRFERNGFASGAHDKDDQGESVSSSLFPTVMHAGWLISSQNEAELETILKVVSDGVSRMSTIVEDGFLNFQRQDYAAPYDEVLLCASVFDQSFKNGEPARGHAKWIPGSRIGLVLTETKTKFMNAGKLGSAKEARLPLWEIYDDGAGQFVAAAGNNLAWYFFMPDLPKYPNDIPVDERVLLQVARLKVKDDSINCLSNLGILNYMARNIDRAIELFEQVLADEDDYSDNEACFYLARIHDQLGNTSKVEEYRELYATLSPYGWPLQEQLPLDVIEAAAKEVSSAVPEYAHGQSYVPPVASAVAAPSATPANSSVAKFCGSCGAPFANDEEKFCGKCGSPRP